MAVAVKLLNWVIGGSGDEGQGGRGKERGEDEFHGIRQLSVVSCPLNLSVVLCPLSVVVDAAQPYRLQLGCNGQLTTDNGPMRIKKARGRNTFG
jgi:hypothetical protein